MLKISLYFDRLESYAFLLVATELVRQMFAEVEGDGGIPLISSIWPITANREYTQMDFIFSGLPRAIGWRR